MIFRTLIVLAATGALGAVASAGTINNLPAYSFYGAGYGPSVTQIGSYTTDNPSGANYGQASYGGALTPSPSLSASSDANSGPTGAEAIANSFAELQYYVEVDGPTSSVLVTINGSGGVSGSLTQPGNDQDTFLAVDAKFAVEGLFTDDTNISITDSGGSIENGFVPSVSDNSSNSSGSPAGGYSGSFTENRTIAFTTGTTYTIDLQVKANTLSQGIGMSAMAAAFVDPTFALASGVANAGQYSLTFSPGVGNDVTSPAPEPATWAMLASGLALVTLLRRRLNISLL